LLRLQWLYIIRLHGSDMTTLVQKPPTAKTMKHLTVVAQLVGDNNKDDGLHSNKQKSKMYNDGFIHDASLSMVESQGSSQSVWSLGLRQGNAPPKVKRGSGGTKGDQTGKCNELRGGQ
jgi:hypothetical protein